MSGLSDLFHSDIGRRTVTDIGLALTAISTSPWWVNMDLDHWAQRFVLWCAVLTAVIRLYGIGKDMWRGRKPTDMADDD